MTREDHAATVLCVEDNLANLALVEALFAERPDLHLETARDGRSGLDQVRRAAPDLVLLDLHLPDISGEDVLAQICADAATREIPVVIVTADASPGLGDRLRAAGARDYLLKPFRVDAFWRAVDGALGGTAAA